MSKPLCPVCGRDAWFTHVCKNGNMLQPSDIAPAASIIDQLRADLAAAQKEAKRCADGWDAAHAKHQAELAAAISGGADAAAQRDTALRLCKERERELADVTAERDLQCRMLTDWERIMGEMRTALDLERNARAAIGDEYVSTRTELARSEGRVKAAQDVARKWHTFGDSGARAFADELVEALRNG